jgi:hypothetical protein
VKYLFHLYGKNLAEKETSARSRQRLHVQAGVLSMADNATFPNPDGIFHINP